MAVDSYLRAKCRGRCFERGAAAVEGIIVIGVVTVFLLAGLWLHNAYRAKLAALRDARYFTWTLAMKGCDMKVTAASIGSSFTDPDSGGESSIIEKALALDDATKSSSKPVVAPGGAPWRATMQSSCIVTCNEKAEKEIDLGELVKQEAAKTARKEGGGQSW